VNPARAARPRAAGCGGGDHSGGAAVGGGAPRRLFARRLGAAAAAAFNSPMRVLPVLDLKGGVVVRGVGGRRHEYRPVVSPLSPSPDPLAVAQAFRARFGLTELYLTDLDALAGAAPALPAYAAPRGRGFRLWVDAGVRRAEDAAPLAAAGVEGIVLGLETLAGPGVLAALCRAHGKRVVFSLDLKDGRPLGDLSGWDGPEAWSVA